MLCYAVLWFVMLTYFMSKILCSQWVKSCDLLCSHFWEIVIEVFVSKTLCTVMNSYLMSKILLYLMKLTVSNCNQELLETLSCLMKKNMSFEDILLQKEHLNPISSLLSKSQAGIVIHKHFFAVYKNNQCDLFWSSLN